MASLSYSALQNSANRLLAGAAHDSRVETAALTAPRPQASGAFHPIPSVLDYRGQRGRSGRAADEQLIIARHQLPGIFFLIEEATRRFGGSLAAAGSPAYTCAISAPARFPVLRTVNVTLSIPAFRPLYA